jgi:hypothetical protein
MNRVCNFGKNKSIGNNFFIVFLFLLLSTTFSFAQKSDFESSSIEISINQNDNTVDTSIPVRVATSGINSNVNFILWFMGTKEDVNSTMSNDAFYSKKSILTSGREPNHLLVKTLLKKAINIKAC